MIDHSGEDAGTGKLAGKPPRTGDEQLKSLVKLVKVLECFSLSDRALSLAEICNRTGFPRSTTHRLLASLRDVGFLEQGKERDRYRLGLKLFALGNTALSSFDIHREAAVTVNSLRRLAGHTVHLAMFDGFRAVVIRRADPTVENTTPSTFLENAPAHCTSVGKAILAWQSEEVIDRLIEAGLPKFTPDTISDPVALREELAIIRERGYAIDDGEHLPGLRCIGAPIRNFQGQVIAGISISGPTWQMPKENIPDLAKVVVYHANQITENLANNR
ncbi:IclR family transcriptional regulator [Pelagibacterium luteolum]|uniref:Transcriptional regulator, IclR family n=1 Tax=Pelagibacterium luteolum TaxID=440168 RepID=A0A1G7WJ09_9HYPH|nr:IclR family transcriptional regulator [Pelagibacterium luteolum]SDG71868.1 transcriptional regulator, IclR family [Pelagibacterium luteolum]